MSEQAGEKTFAPTPKRRQDAAKNGDVLRSRELATAAAFGAGTLWLIAAGPWLAEELTGTMRAGLTFDAGDFALFDPATILLRMFGGLLLPVITLGLSVLGATLVAQLAFGNARFLAANCLPKPARLNPLSGLGRMFGAHGLLELGKSLIKVAVLCLVFWWWSGAHLASFRNLGSAPLQGQVAAAWNAIAGLLLWLAGGLGLIAMVDWPVEWLRWIRRLRMTQQEMRDEHKESEGSPEKKAAIRQRQRSLARGGVARAVQEADFILVNPAHFSVALVYDPARAAAPIVLAKGRDDRAIAMRELAAEHRVPVLEYPVLARSVYFTTRENQVVREELYAAIASLLAFVMSLKRGEKRAAPVVAVPVTLHFDAAGRPSRT